MAQNTSDTHIMFQQIKSRSFKPMNVQPPHIHHRTKLLSDYEKAQKNIKIKQQMERKEQ